ncbi:HIT domain-containing protein [Halomonas halocynthiae]|uniref:HIT domain-containing protein n=1 Tax=Halomonas halocynthiae TaxID=176290 RepID=UPI0003F9B921|nr:HIT family protein [Halomonas halocynthiae]
MPSFTPDARLVADSHLVAELPLCQLRMMNDQRYVWLILIPRYADIHEVYELSAADQRQLWQEGTLLGQAIKQHFAGDKLNIATLGNVVSQLHLHVVLRHQRDPAWPGPVWGHSPAEPYTNTRQSEMRRQLLTLINTIRWE